MITSHIAAMRNFAKGTQCLKEFMLIQPPVFYSVGAFTIPLPENLWQFFSTHEQAQEVLKKVLLVVPDAQIVDGTRFLTMPVQSIDDTVKIWLINGTYNDGQVSEYAGSLFDRQSQPNVWIDKNPNGSVGGPNLHVTQYGQYCELSWRA